MDIREQIKARARAVEKVAIDGLGEVGVRRLTVKDMLEISSLPQEDQRVAMLARCAVDADSGDAVFASAEEVHAADFGLGQDLIAACLRINGLDAKVEDAQKN